MHQIRYSEKMEQSNITMSQIVMNYLFHHLWRTPSKLLFKILNTFSFVVFYSSLVCNHWNGKKFHSPSMNFVVPGFLQSKPHKRQTYTVLHFKNTTSHVPFKYPLVAWAAMPWEYAAMMRLNRRLGLPFILGQLVSFSLPTTQITAGVSLELHFQHCGKLPSPLPLNIILKQDN